MAQFGDLRILPVSELAKCCHVDCGEPVQLLVHKPEYLLPLCGEHGKEMVKEQTGKRPVWFEPLGYIVKGGL